VGTGLSNVQALRPKQRWGRRALLVWHVRILGRSRKTNTRRAETYAEKRDRLCLGRVT